MFFSQLFSLAKFILHSLDNDSSFVWRSGPLQDIIRSRISDVCFVASDFRFQALLRSAMCLKAVRCSVRGCCAACAAPELFRGFCYACAGW